MCSLDELLCRLGMHYFWVEPYISVSVYKSNFVYFAIAYRSGIFFFIAKVLPFVFMSP